MKAMQLRRICSLSENKKPLLLVDLPDPVPAENEILIRLSACGVCHTEIDEIEGRTPPPKLPVIPGHQAVGRVEGAGSAATRYQIGDRVGVAWIYSACGRCRFCTAGNENLCADFVATGRDRDGGYAQYMVVSENFAIPIPPLFSDAEAAPLLCAGSIGYRSLKLCGLSNGENLGLSGFGASAHLVLKLAKHLYPDTRIFVFARSEREQNFARELGAAWVGDTSATAPDKLKAIIDTTPVWEPVLHSLKNLDAGGRLVINAIRKEEADKQALAELDYPSHLWMEKEIKSVANVTRADVQQFLELAAEISLTPEIQEFPLEDANAALVELRERKIRGAKVLAID
ncbi:MAG TPA: zinc-dependent alcohol dehydrogenase family protein [Acidobacteriota bacterium]